MWLIVTYCEQPQVHIIITHKQWMTSETLKTSPIKCLSILSYTVIPNTCY